MNVELIQVIGVMVVTRHVPLLQSGIYAYSKTCLKRNAIIPVFFSVFTGFRFTKGCVLIEQSTKNMIA